MNRLLNYSFFCLITMVLILGCTHKTTVKVLNEHNSTNLYQVNNIKHGISCTTWFLNHPKGFETSSRIAAANGNITQIHRHEYSSSNFILWGNRCITVYGI